MLWKVLFQGTNWFSTLFFVPKWTYFANRWTSIGCCSQLTTKIGYTKPLIDKITLYNRNNNNFFGHHPLMTCSSPCQLVALNSQSFSRREKLGADSVVNKLALKTDPEFVDILVTWHANEPFINFRKTNTMVAWILLQVLKQQMMVQLIIYGQKKSIIKNNSILQFICYYYIITAFLRLLLNLLCQSK